MPAISVGFLPQETASRSVSSEGIATLWASGDQPDTEILRFSWLQSRGLFEKIEKYRHFCRWNGVFGCPQGVDKSQNERRFHKILAKIWRADTYKLQDVLPDRAKCGQSARICIAIPL